MADSKPAASHLFVSYASADRERVLPIADVLTQAGFHVWLDRAGIPGGVSYGPEITAAIKEAAAFLLICSSDALDSRNVRQEIQLAWRFERPIVPLLLETLTFPDDLAYWLEGHQWVEVFDRPSDAWLSDVLHALEKAGMVETQTAQAPAATTVPGISARLPTPLTELLGRDAEIKSLVELLASHRLVTLTGPGGVGKTRLAIETARVAIPAFPGGVHFVDLSPVRDHAQVLATIARALGVREAADTQIEDALAGAVGDRRVLLVLDNLEQVIDAASALARLLTACEHLAVLATSRGLLAVRGEHAHPVEPLPVPAVGEGATSNDLSSSPAVALFVVRAREARPGFAPDGNDWATIAAICRRLDGLPLAIELAAARVRLLTPVALLARLEQALPTLTGGQRDLPERQRTMAAAIAWSHDLLGLDEQTLFRRLAAFVGGFSLEAAEAVVEVPGRLSRPVLEVLGSLIDNSMLREETDPGGDTRFRMLDTVREFASERLAASGDAEAVHRAHAAFFLSFAERVEPELQSSTFRSWVGQVEVEHGNVSGALTWFEREEDTVAVMRLAGALDNYWYFQERWGEGRGWLERSLATRRPVPEDIRAKALMAAGRLASYQGDDASAVPWLEAGRSLYRKLGNVPDVAWADFVLGVAAEDRGDYVTARATLTEALASGRRLGDQVIVNWCLVHLSVVAFGEENLAEAVALGEQACSLARELGDTEAASVAALYLAHVACAKGDHAEAATWFRKGFRSTSLGRDKPEWLARGAAGVAMLAAACGDAEGTALLFGAAAAARAKVGLALALPERTFYEQAEAVAVAELGEEAFAGDVQIGQRLQEREIDAVFERVLAAAEAGAAPITRT